MLNLTIHHNINLTRDQRYLLHEGEQIDTIGICVPVWTLNKKTTEPAKEVFCKYYIKNTKEEKPMKILEDGFEITIPFKVGQKLEISDEEWRDLTMNDPDKLRSLYQKLNKEFSSKNLLDLKDGGSEFLNYRELNKVPCKNKIIEVMNHIVIGSMEKLENNLLQ